MQNSNPEKILKNGFTGIGLVVFLVLVAVTVAFIVLTVNVSGWFVIGAIIFGGYTAVVGIWTLVMRKMIDSFDRF